MQEDASNSVSSDSDESAKQIIFELPKKARTDPAAIDAKEDSMNAVGAKDCDHCSHDSDNDFKSSPMRSSLGRKMTINSNKKSECIHTHGSVLNKEDLLKRTADKKTKTHTEINEEGQAILKRLRDAFALRMVKKNDEPEVKEEEK